MVKKVHNQKGFSLLELIVVTGVLLSITGFIVINYNNFNSVEKLRQAGKQLRNDIRLIQNKASSGVKPAGCTTLSGYQMSFTQNSYSYQALCTNGLQGQVSTISLAGGITFNPLPSAIVFTVLTGTIASDTLLTVSNSSKTYMVSINRSGDVADLGLQ